MLRIASFTIGAVSLAVAAVPANAVNLVANPGFETGDFAGWTQFGDTSFSSVTCDTFGGIAPTEGDCQAFFGPVDDFGGITQNITTVVGQTYNVSFDVANLDGPPNGLAFSFDGLFYVLAFDLDAFPYTTIGGPTLAATTTSTEISFFFNHPPSFFLLDNVSIEAAIPEPASWALMIAGFGLLGGTVRRRRVTFAHATA